MKKLLSMLGTIILTGVASTSVIACDKPDSKKDTIIDISNKITSTIALGKLDTNTKVDFLAKLQTALAQIPDLKSITPSDYDVYKAGTTTDIPDSEIPDNNSLNIKIVAKGNKFTGNKDDIKTTYNQNDLHKQNTIYIDENGNKQTTSKQDLSDINSKEIIKIGFYQNYYGQIQAVKMPKTIEKVPNQLPQEITSLTYMFSDALKFNQDISEWDTLNVTDMSFMFYGASAFNQDLLTKNTKKWNTSNVTNMKNMFSDAVSFNQDLSSWNTSNVTDMSNMFYGASAFNQDLSSWNVDKVINMKNMFSDAVSFNQDLSSLNTSNVTDMSLMFSHCEEFDQDISSWDTSNVTNMSYMFAFASSFNQDLSNWKVDKVTNHINFAIASPIDNTDKLPKFKN